MTTSTDIQDSLLTAFADFGEDIPPIIVEYVEDLNHADKYKKCLGDINNFSKYNLKHTFPLSITSDITIYVHNAVEVFIFARERRQRPTHRFYKHIIPYVNHHQDYVITIYPYSYRNVRICVEYKNYIYTYEWNTRLPRTRYINSPCMNLIGVLHKTTHRNVAFAEHEWE